MVHERKEQNYLTTVSLAILAFVALAFALVYTRAVMIPFVLALFIVALVSPVQDFQVKRLRFPRIIAALLTLLVVLVIVALVSLLVTYTIQTVVSTARDYSDSMGYVVNKVLKPLELIYWEEEEPLKPQAAPGVEPNTSSLHAAASDMATLDANDVAGVGLNEVASAKRVRKLNTKQLVSDMKQHILNIATNAAGTIFGLISSVFFVVIFVMFLVMGRDPYATHSETQKNIIGKVRRYVGTKVIISFVTGLLVWFVLSRFGLPLASVFGILAFLLNFIPSIGSVISTLLPLPVAVAQFQVPVPPVENEVIVGLGQLGVQGPPPEPEMMVAWGTVLLVTAIPGVIQVAMGNVIEPKLMGEGLNLHPVTILLALSFWGLLWGVVGMFLAAPITAALRIVLLQFDTFKPIGRLLAGDFSSAEPSEP